ncbi:MAG TPA: group II intron reverse transcriptase/maturase [Saprospiraceae bacterium]|nr:group II intron reverse transcriptase/maturase [Saprospiraceae bacterium]
MSATNRSGNNRGERHATPRELMELLVTKENMTNAYKQVVKNKGAAGVDGLEVTELKDYLQKHWSVIKDKLLTDGYYPQAVRRVEIPKADGGKRMLGIPTVVDRLIQQALHQVLNPLYDPSFSQWSYGFRTGKSAHDAIRQARDHINKGKRWIVDVDLSKFFDEVNHERLISRLRKRIADRRVIHLIHRYLRAGIMEEGIVEPRRKGTPQGSPVSPLLSNIVLDELDKELEKRGHFFVRYADDFQIYVGSKQTAERVMESISHFIEKKLRLKVNKEKSKIGRPWECTLLGYTFTRNKETKMRVSKASIQRLRNKIKEKFRQGRGRNLSRFIVEDLNPLLLGWINYFKLSEVKGFAEELDGWIRRHLRKTKWRQWKRPWTRRTNLIALGLREEQAVMSAFNQRGAWWNAGASHMNLAMPIMYFESLKLVSLQHETRRHHLSSTSVNRRDT